LFVRCFIEWHLGCPTQQPVRGELKLNKIDENLYEISPQPEVSGAGGNVTILLTSEGVILVGDKYDYDHNGILAKVKTITDKPIRYIINTHLEPFPEWGRSRRSLGRWRSGM
jgi:hypothetical protein